jgi:hypothetical protein
VPNIDAHATSLAPPRVPRYFKKLDAELRDRKERLKRTAEKMAGLVDFLATGDLSQYVITTGRGEDIR